jgi:hypothetical protein
MCESAFKKSKNIETPTPKGCIERNVHGALSAYKPIYDEKSYKPSKPPRAYF